jgi:hypothetical protein
MPAKKSIKPAQPTITFPAPQEMKDWVRAQADADRRTSSAWMRLVVERMMVGEGHFSVETQPNQEQYVQEDQSDSTVSPDDLVAAALQTAEQQGATEPQYEEVPQPQGVRSLRKPVSRLSPGNHGQIERFLGR